MKQFLDHISKIVPYPSEVMKLNTTEGFEQYYSYFSKAIGCGGQIAYHRTELLHEKFFGVRRYKNYNSFRHSMEARKAKLINSKLTNN